MADLDSTGCYFDQQKGRWRVQFRQTIGGRTVRKSKLLPSGLAEGEAREIAASMKADTASEIADTKLYWERTVTRAAAIRGSWVWGLWNRARVRAKAKNRDFALTIEDVANLCIRSRGRCELTGIMFANDASPKRMRPFAPSLDRKDASLGYSTANCRIVCAAVNLAMFTWGESAFRAIAVGYVTRLLCPKDAHHEPPSSPAVEEVSRGTMG